MSNFHHQEDFRHHNFKGQGGRGDGHFEVVDIFHSKSHTYNDLVNGQQSADLNLAKVRSTTIILEAEGVCAYVIVF